MSTQLRINFPTPQAGKQIKITKETTSNGVAWKASEWPTYLDRDQNTFTTVVDKYTRYVIEEVDEG